MCIKNSTRKYKNSSISYKKALLFCILWSIKTKRCLQTILPSLESRPYMETKRIQRNVLIEAKQKQCPNNLHVLLIPAITIYTLAVSLHMHYAAFILQNDSIAIKFYVVDPYWDRGFRIQSSVRIDSLCSSNFFSSQWDFNFRFLWSLQLHYWSYF